MAYNDYSNSSGTFDGTSLVLYPGYPQFDRSEGSRELVYKYWCKTTLAHDGTGGLIPARFSTITYKDYTYYLANVTTSEQSDPLMSDIVMTYNRSGSKVEPIRSDGDIQRSIEPIVLTKPAKKSISVGEEDRAEQKIWGLEYDYETTKTNFSWTEDNIVKSFQDKVPMMEGTPTGDTLPVYSA